MFPFLCDLAFLEPVATRKITGRIVIEVPDEACLQKMLTDVLPAAADSGALTVNALLADKAGLVIEDANDGTEDPEGAMTFTMQKL